MVFVFDERVDTLLEQAGWTVERSEELYTYQVFSNTNDPRIKLCKNLNGLEVKSENGQKIDFFRPEGDHPLLADILVEDILERTLREAQEFEGLKIDDPIFLAYVTTSPSPFCLYVDKHFQFFVIGEGIFYVGGNLETALHTILFNWSSSRFVNRDGSLVDLNENPVAGSVFLA